MDLQAAELASDHENVGKQKAKESPNHKMI